MILVPIVLTFLIGLPLSMWTDLRWVELYEFVLRRFGSELSFYHVTTFIGLLVGLANGGLSALLKVSLPKSFLQGTLMFFLNGFAMFSVNELIHASRAEEYFLRNYMEWSLVPTLIGSLIIALLTMGIGRIANRPA